MKNTKQTIDCYGISSELAPVPCSCLHRSGAGAVYSKASTRPLKRTRLPQVASGGVAAVVPLGQVRSRADACPCESTGVAGNVFRPSPTFSERSQKLTRPRSAKHGQGQLCWLIQKRGQTVLPMAFEGQRDRSLAPGETHSHGVGNGPLRLNQQSHDLLYLGGELSRLVEAPCLPIKLTGGDGA
jgi:hypothetical protein